MVSSDDMIFWTGLTVSEDDVTKYTNAVIPQFMADGGNMLPDAVKTESLCYLIASKIDNKTNNGLTSEHLGSYSYTRKSTVTSSKWLDLYRELLSTYTKLSVPRNSAGVTRCDVSVFHLNRRYR